MANDPLVLELIRFACLAGANRVAAKHSDYGRGGFEKLAAKHSRRVAELADEVGRRGSYDIEVTG